MRVYEIDVLVCFMIQQQSAVGYFPGPDAVFSTAKSCFFVSRIAKVIWYKSDIGRPTVLYGLWMFRLTVHLFLGEASAIGGKRRIRPIVTAHATRMLRVAPMVMGNSTSAGSYAARVRCRETASIRVQWLFS
jgi:hypothetical protein